MGLRTTWKMFKANRWAFNANNGKRFQYTVHLLRQGDPRATEWMDEWRSEFAKAMFSMWAANPQLGPVFNSDPQSFDNAVRSLFDQTVTDYCNRLDPKTIPYATALGEIWETVTRRVAGLLEAAASDRG